MGGRGNSLCMLPPDPDMPWVPSPSQVLDRASARLQVSSQYINEGAVKFARELEEEEEEAGSSISILLQLSKSELADALAEEEDDKAPKVVIVPQTLEVLGEEVQHSFVGEEEVDSSSELEMPSKLMKGIKVGPYRKRRRGAGAISTTNSSSTFATTPELWNLKLSIRDLKCHASKHNSRVRNLSSLSAGCDATPRCGIALKGRWGDDVQPHSNAKCPKGSWVSHHLRGKGKEELATANAELSKKWGRLPSSTKWPKAISIYQWVYDRDWNRAEEFYRDVAEEQADAFHKGWVACLRELGTPSDHLAWVATKPLVAYLEPRLEPYSPILLLSFDEEEYFSLPVKGKEDIADGAAKVEEAEAKQDVEAKVEAPRAASDL
ncbi:hypothetical protein Acr_25g0005160 [Actinidia rufa]|uniref:Uncharacterized protein n=1 Tax=Actinidia rufa TaxID=165716 RepID=A0A7J0GZ42_9ERIC|nr:hypothetical protein Acr_25g0005160 [Actinidia rufa]